MSERGTEATQLALPVGPRPLGEAYDDGPDEWAEWMAWLLERYAKSKGPGVTERLPGPSALFSFDVVAALGLVRGLPAEDKGVVLAAGAADTRDMLDDSDHELAVVEFDADGGTDVGEDRDFGDPGTLDPVDGDPDAQQRHERGIAATHSDDTRRHASPIVDWSEAGKLPGFRLGGRLRFRLSEVEAVLEASRFGPPVKA